MKFRNKKERFQYIRQTLEKRLSDHTALGITEEKLKEVRDLLLTPVDSKATLHRLMKRKLWRLNYCYNVVDKKAKSMPFIMKIPQFKVYLVLDIHKKIINLKSRQHGISTLWLIVFLDDCVWYENVESGMISTDNAARQNLLKRASYTWETMESWAKEAAGVRVDKSDSKKHIVFSNHSVLKIDTKFRGQTIMNLHISELGAIAADSKEKTDEIMTGSAQAVSEDGIIVIESTAMGENKFSELYREGVEEVKRGKKLEEGSTYVHKYDSEMFYPVFLSWLEDEDSRRTIEVPDSPAYLKYKEELNKEGIILTPEQRNFWIAKHRTAGDKMFREYPTTAEEAFRVSQEGTIFAQHYLDYAHINEQLPEPHQDFNWHPELPVYVTFDIGIYDETFLIFMQICNEKILIIGEKSFTGTGWDDITTYLNLFRKDNQFIPEADRKYKYDYLIFPHDGNQRKQADKVYSPVDYMRRRDWSVQISPSKSTNDNALIREYMSQIYINDTCCPKLHKSLLNYRKKYDKKHGIYKDEPEHDEFSHAIDSLRYGLAKLESKFRNKDEQEYRGAPTYG